MVFQDTLTAYHDQARAAIEQVLAEPEFADLRTDVENYWLLFLDWLKEVLEGIGGYLRGLPGWLFWPLVAWLVLTLLAILGHFAYVLFGVISASGLRRAGRKGAESEGSGELLGIRELDFDSVYQRAQQFMASSNWKEATKYLYVAAILWLDRQGWIGFKVSKTNQDYLADLAGRPDQRARFRLLTVRFESTAYGGADSTAGNCQEMADLLEVLRREATPVVPV